MGTTARVVHMLLLSAWFGGCLLFAAVVAPNAFTVIPSREIAGNMVTLTLHAIDLFGLCAGPVLLLTLAIGWLPLGAPLKLRAFMIVLMLAAVAASFYWITPEMLRLRHAMPGPIETVAETDPLRVEFGKLHSFSEALLTAHAVLSLVVMVYAIAGTTPSRKGGIEL